MLVEVRVRFITVFASIPKNNLASDPTTSMILCETSVKPAIPNASHRREIICCKRAILSLSSSKILTPHPPLPLASVYPPAFVGGEDTLARRRGGWAVNILEDGRDMIALL